MSGPATTRSRIGARRGVVLAAALACLFLTVLMAAGLTASLLERQRSLKRHERDLQAAWLAESAVDRAVARLQADATYAGETWTIPADELGRRFAGKAVISVAAAESNGGRRISIEAFFPDDPIQRTRVAKEITVGAPAAGSDQASP